MKKYAPVLILALLGLSILAYKPIKNAIFPKPSPVNPGDDPATFKNIKNEIEQLSNMPWEKQRFQSIETDIKAANSANLLSDQGRNQLTETLNNYYVDQLIKATKAFFNGGCDDRRRLGALNSELRRYKNGKNVRQGLKSVVAEMRTATSSTWYVIGYERNGKNMGIDGKILDYTQNRPFDQSRTDALLEELLNRSSQAYLRNCALIRQSVNLNRKRLDNHYFEALQEEVQNYTQNAVFSPTEYQIVIEKVQDYKSANILGDSSQVSAKTNQILSLLDEFYLNHKNAQE